MDNMLDELTSVQITELMAYDRLEPIGFRHQEISTARLCSAIYGAAFATIQTKKKPDPPGAGYFLEQWDASKRLLELIDREQDVDAAAEIAISAMKVSVGKTVTVYEGDAPPVKRIGKRAAKIGSKKRAQLDAIFGKRSDS